MVQFGKRFNHTDRAAWCWHTTNNNMNTFRAAAQEEKRKKKGEFGEKCEFSG